MTEVSSVFFCRKCSDACTVKDNTHVNLCPKCYQSQEDKIRALVVGDQWEGRGNVVHITNTDRRYVSYCFENGILGHSTKESFRRRFKPILTADTPPLPRPR